MILADHNANVPNGSQRFKELQKEVVEMAPEDVKDDIRNLPFLATGRFREGWKGAEG